MSEFGLWFLVVIFVNADLDRFILKPAPFTTLEQCEHRLVMIEERGMAAFTHNHDQIILDWNGICLPLDPYTE